MIFPIQQGRRRALYLRLRPRVVPPLRLPPHPRSRTTPRVTSLQACWAQGWPWPWRCLRERLFLGTHACREVFSFVCARPTRTCIVAFFLRHDMQYLHGHNAQKKTFAPAKNTFHVCLSFDNFPTSCSITRPSCQCICFDAFTTADDKMDILVSA